MHQIKLCLHYMHQIQWCLHYMHQMNWGPHYMCQINWCLYYMCQVNGCLHDVCQINWCIHYMWPKSWCLHYICQIKIHYMCQINGCLHVMCHINWCLHYMWQINWHLHYMWQINWSLCRVPNKLASTSCVTNILVSLSYRQIKHMVCQMFWCLWLYVSCAKYVGVSISWQIRNKWVSITNVPIYRTLAVSLQIPDSIHSCCRFWGNMESRLNTRITAYDW